MYTVIIKRGVAKNISKIPKFVQKKLRELIKDLMTEGPVQTKWPNYSKIGLNKYHCHLAYKWIACWTCMENSLEIEVYYAGSRENAPY